MTDPRYHPGWDELDDNERAAEHQRWRNTVCDHDPVYCTCDEPEPELRKSFELPPESGE